MKLVLFLTAEFIHMITASFLIVILFLGGWHLWGMSTTAEPTWLGALLRCAVLMAKIFCVVLFFMLVRWSWPRFRFDQLMSLAWKIMLPLGLVNLLAVAILEELQHPEMLGSWFQRTFGDGTMLIESLVGWGVAVIALLAVALIGPLITDNRPRHDLHPNAIKRATSQGS
jgi:NADH-quinone oxidoreductase subunit H